MIEYLNIFFTEVYKIVFLLIPVLTAVAMIVWLDRRVWAFVQKRRGPNVVGPFGLFQTLADALKYLFKEIIIPASSNKPIFVMSNSSFERAIRSKDSGLFLIIAEPSWPFAPVRITLIVYSKFRE